MTRRMSPDGICWCCGRVGAVFADVVRAEIGYVTVTDPDMPPLCDRCEYAQKRWEAAESVRRNPTLSYPYTQGPPKTPPVTRRTA